jgi:putative membrane protein
VKPQQPADTEPGEEPDYRFSLANERTFLAWVRTALATLAAAVGVSELVPNGHLDWLRRALALLLGALGLLIAAGLYLRWRASEQAIRTGRPLPRSPLLPLISAGMALAACCVLVLLIAR